MKAAIPYALKQLMWMLKITLQLIFLMSTGVLWIQQMIRLYIFAGFVWIFFVPHWWWYLTSANIIRRVSYRSSRTTKRRNILRVLEAEGVADVPELVKREQRLQRQQHIRAARGLAGPRGGGSPFPVEGNPIGGGSGGNRRRPPPPMSGAAAAAAAAAGGAVVSPTVIGPYTVSSFTTGRRLPPPARTARRSGSGRAPPQLHSPADGGVQLTTGDAHAAPQTDRRTGPSSAASSDLQAFDKLIRESERFSNVNPADGSILRSLPRNSQTEQPQQRRRQYHEGQVRSAEDGDARSVTALRADPQFQPFLQAFPDRDSKEGEGEERETRETANDDADCQKSEQPLEGAAQTPAPALSPRTRPLPRRRPTLLQRLQSPPPFPRRPEQGGSPVPSSSSRGNHTDWVDIDEEDEEDRLNLHNRATVDIILPVPLDSLMKSMDYAKRSSKFRRKKFPIVIDVSGGAWIIGSHLWSTMLSRVLAARGYVVFCPDYRNFPQTTMEGMTLDVSDAIGWVLNNAERYNGDLSDVTLMGQSAGAHLTMLSLLSQAQLCAYEATRMRGFDGTSVPPPSSVAYNVPRYNPRQSIHRYVGLSGIYNLERLVPHFHRRGLNTPVLQKIAGGKDQLPRYSIHAYFDRTRSGDTGEVLPDNFFDFLPQRMFFLHGDADTAAPVTESSSLVGVLRQAQMEFTLRRLTRNEENHRHAYRSRGLLPGALASPINFDPCSFSETRPAQEDGGGDGRTSCTDSSHGGKEEGGEDQRRPRKDGGKKDSRRGSASFPGEPRQSMALSPIVPPSRSDLPLTAVDLEFILIPDATHTDAIIEECIVANCSCCADFICDYFTDGSQPPSVASPVLPLNLGASWGGASESPYTPNTARTASVTAASYTNAPGAFPTFASDASTNETAATAAGVARNANSDYVLQKLEKVSRCSRSVPFCVPPDGILPMVVPPEDRPRVLNWITYFCPF